MSTGSGTGGLRESRPPAPATVRRRIPRRPPVRSWREERRGDPGAPARRRDRVRDRAALRQAALLAPSVRLVRLFRLLRVGVVSGRAL